MPASAQKAPRFAVTVVLPGPPLVERTDAIVVMLASSRMIRDSALTHELKCI